MPILVRKISMNKWVNDDFDWLEEADISADVVSDFGTTQNTLSLFLVSNEQEAKRAVAALVADQLGETKHVGYVIIDQETLDRLGLDTEQTKGRTQDDEVNGWHRDIVRLSAMNIVHLAKVIKANYTLIKFFPDDLAATIEKAIEDNKLKLSLDKIKDQKIRKKIEAKKKSS